LEASSKWKALGIWVRGSSHQPVSNLDIVIHLMDSTLAPNRDAQQVALKQKVLNASDVLDAIVVRETLVYKRSCPDWELFIHRFISAEEAGEMDIEISLSRARPTSIHLDYLAS
jgi:hypothetical protein